MKKITFYAIATALLLSFNPLKSMAETNIIPVATSSIATTSNAQANTYLARLDEINKLDKKSLSPRQRKTLRSEVKSIQKRLQEMNGGIYLSIGAIILILLLLIILF